MEQTSSSTAEKLLLVRVQDDLHGARHDGRQLVLNYQREPGYERNTLHFTVNSIVSDAVHGRFNVASDGQLKGKVVIIADPREMPSPAGWGQVDSWWRLRSAPDASGQLQRTLGVGNATIVAPKGMPVPDGVKAVYYEGGLEARDEAVRAVFAGRGVEMQTGSFWGWSGHSQKQDEWRRETVAALWPGREQHIHLGPHSGSLDQSLEDSTLRGHVQAMKENGRLHADHNGTQEVYVDVMDRKADEARQRVQRLLTQVAPPEERALIAPHYEAQLQRIDSHLKEARELDAKLVAKMQQQQAQVPSPLPQEHQTHPSLSQAVQVPPPLPEAAQMAPPNTTQVPEAQATKLSIRHYEAPGDFELTAEGREPRFYDNARLAGEAFYAARREDQPRVVQHYLDGFEDRTGRYETPSTRTIAITARTAAPDQKLEHIFLDDSPEFKAGYEAARARLPGKAVLTEDWTQPAGQQQSIAASSQPPSAQSPETPEAPVPASSKATELKGQTVGEQQIPGKPPRVQVGLEPNHWLNENAQWHRDVADRRGLTTGIEAQFAEGKTAKQVIKAMGKELEFLPIEDRSNFIVGVRATLGIPSQATSEGQQEFKAWKAEYDKRQAFQSATVAQPQQKGPTMNMTRLQIDGVDVGRLAFEKHSTPHGVFVDLTALDRNEQPLAEFRGVDKVELTKLLGSTVGHEVAKFQGREGELHGAALDVPLVEIRPAQSQPQREADIEQKDGTPYLAQAKAHQEQAPSRRLEINGQPVERLSYVKRQTEQGMRYEVTAYGSGDRVIAKRPALAKEELAAYLGETAAKSLEATRGRNGSLRGEALVSPADEAQSTRAATAEVKQARATLPSGAVPDKAVEINWREARRIEAHREIGVGADTFSVTIHGTDDKVLDQQEGLTRGGLSARYGDERAAMMAQIAHQNYQAEHKPKPTAHAAEQAVTTDKQPPIVNSIEELLQKAGVVQQEAHTLPPRLQKIVDSLEKDKVERAGQPGNTQERQPDSDIKIGTYALPEVPSDPAERRRQELLASLAERFTVNAGEYRARHDQSQVAFVDRDKAVTTARNEPEIARAMVDLAEAKGWKGLHLKGTEPFKAAAWMEASMRGLPTHGYEPTRADRERLGIKLRERDAAMQTNRIEPMESRQGAAREQAAPAQERAAVDPQAAKAREHAMGALEVYLRSQNVPKERMEVLMKQGAEALDKLAAQGKVPEVRVFDAQAQRAHTVHIQTTQQVATPQRSR